MNGRIWLLFPAAFLAALVIIGMVNAAGASLPTGSSSAALPLASGSSGSAAQKGAAPSKDDPFGIANFNCADISRYGVDKQLNMRAAAILQKCGYGPKSQNGALSLASLVTAPFAKLLSPLYGGTDINLITGSETFPNITQSETFSWSNGSTVVVAYNNSRGRNFSPINISGASVSTDGGTTFTRLTGANGQSPFGGTEGDPVVLYAPVQAMWLTVWLDTGCGAQGLGGYKSTTPADPNSWTHFCVFSEASADRESGWADSTGSPFNGRVYVSWNDFNVSSGALFSTFSTDGGVNWHAPVQVANTFIRDVQFTGDVNGSGDVYIAGMDEMGGGLTNRANKMYRSTDGGNTWTNTYTGPTFAAPGRSASGFFATMYATVPGVYWRHQGWGQPGAYGNIVHYVYSAHGTGSDPSDMFYIRSTDSGVTFSAPMLLNTDGDATKAQWQGNLSVGQGDTVFAGWYDERNNGRNDNSCANAGMNSPCYQRFGRSSPDGGVTWQPDAAVSDVVSPLPSQPDPGIQPVYVGDYDYAHAEGTTHYQAWVDGRTLINSSSQQDVYFDKPVQGTPTPTVTGTPPTATRTPTRTRTPTSTPTPCGPTGNYSYATGTAAIVAGTTDIGNHCDDCLTLISLPFPYTLYDQTFTAAQVSSNGQLDFGTGDTSFTNTCLPDTAATYAIFPYWDDLFLVNTGFGVFTSVSGTAPNRIFNIEWRAQYFPGSGTANFEVRLYEGQNRFDIIYGTLTNGNTSATSGVQGPSGLYTQYFCNGVGGTATGSVIYTQPPCATPTRTPSNTPTPTNTRTNTPVPPTPTACTITFTDVPPSSTFYQWIHCLVCLGIVNGYSDGTFKPNANVTRGQLSKIVSNSAGFTDTPSGQQFQDVPPSGSGSTFYPFIYRLVHRGFIGGYACGGAGEPCIPPANLPYFRPNANATRGQISKIVSNAAGFSNPPCGQQFQDVPTNNAFYAFIYRLSTRGIINGYACGGAGEPCVPPANLPYFRPNANATRGQMAKIDAQAFFPDCNIPALSDR